MICVVSDATRSVRWRNQKRNRWWIMIMIWDRKLKKKSLNRLIDHDWYISFLDLKTISRCCKLFKSAVQIIQGVIVFFKCILFFVSPTREQTNSTGQVIETRLHANRHYENVVWMRRWTWERPKDDRCKDVKGSQVNINKIYNRKWIKKSTVFFHSVVYICHGHVIGERLVV